MKDDERFDVVIVGGGIHGVGVAQAAAAAGYSVLLLEKSELAAGTSRRSSKLIHGGLRYLESLQLSLVRESLRERELLLKLAPGLVRRQAFFIPVYAQTTRRPTILRIGLSLYALLAGLGKNSTFRKVPKQEWTQLDGLTTAGLQHVYQYWDAQTDDAALTRAVMKSAESMGAKVHCPAHFKKAKISDSSVECSYEYQGEEKRVVSDVIVNAAGPWARTVATQIDPQPDIPQVDNVQGSHLELPGIVNRGCYYVEAPTDRRAVFVMPWQECTLLGTTELVYSGDPDKCVPTKQETDYLLATYAHYFPGRPREVLNSWAGLRVLPAATGEAFSRPRETHLTFDRASQPRSLSIYGGKLTGYRATAEKVVKLLQPSLPTRNRVAQTDELPLV